MAALAALTVGWAASAGAAPGTSPGGHDRTAFDGDNPRVEARLLVHPDDTAGGSVRVGVLFEIDPGWHIYARDPGDTGLPTELRWNASGGEVEPGPWPPPRSYTELEGELISYGYEGRVLLPARASFPPPGSAERRLRAEVELLACEVECIPGSLRLERTIGSAGPPAPELARAWLGAPASASAPPPGGGAPRVGMARALLFALLGGLLLNLMPCVLPVLAIKALSLAELARSDPREAAPHAIAYVTGVELSMLVLAALVVGLRAAGTAVGWGFQFQEPLFVVAVSAVLVVFALNLFGVFEIGVDTGGLATIGSAATGARRSFFDGLLTVVLATPCSAPFLGTAVGFAFASPAPLIAAIFLAIGAGLAAPLALAVLVPGSARRLPRAGPWMLELRVVLGFGLLAAVVWLLWVLGRSVGADRVAAALAFLLGVGFATWSYGRLQGRGRAPRPALLALACGALLALAAGGWWSGQRDAPPDEGFRTEPYDAELLAKRLSEGRPVFLYFTADWCITCKVNERWVIRDPRVTESLARHDVAVLEADWTRRDEAIRSALAGFGRSGVPLYVLYPASDPAHPTLLPEVLSVSRFLSALRSLVGSGSVSPVTGPVREATIQGWIEHFDETPRKAP